MTNSTTTGITVTTPHALTLATEKRAAADAAKAAARLTRSTMLTNNKTSEAPLEVAAVVAPDNTIRCTAPLIHVGKAAILPLSDDAEVPTAKTNRADSTSRKKVLDADKKQCSSNVTPSIAACADILAAFNANWCYSINEFLCLYLNDDYLRKHQNVDPKLVRTICSNYVKYAKLVDATVDGFMASELGSATARESERFILCIVAYWCLFCLGASDAGEAKNWTFQQDVLHVFAPWLGYSLQRFVWALFQLEVDAFSDKLKVRTLKRDERLDDFVLDTVQYTWFEIFDREFIEQKVLQPLLRNRTRAQAQAADNRVKRSEKRNQTRRRGATKPMPFKLTQAKPPAVYEIEQVPQLQPARPFPKQLFERIPAEHDILLKKRDRNHKKSRILLVEAQEAAPECASPSYMKAPRQIPTSDASKRTPFKSRPVPQFYSSNKMGGPGGDVTNNSPPNPTDGGNSEAADAATGAVTTSAEFQRQINRAYLLRENHKLKQKREHVVRRLNEASDAFIKDIEFERLMNERMEQEQADQVLSSINKRVYALQIFEKAISGVNNVVVQKKAMSTQMRQERDKLLGRHNRRMQRQRAAQHSQTRARRKQMREALESANARAIEEKHRQAHVLKMEGDQLKLLNLQAREEEFEKRRQIIAEIKAMKARLSQAARTRVELDDTQMPGYGFLTELSLCELRERLQLLKHIHAQELADKNQRILAERAADREALGKIKTLIARQRQVERDVKPPAALKQRLEATRNRVEASLKGDVQYVNVVKRLRKAVQDRKRMNRALRKNHPAAYINRSRSRRRIPIKARFQQHSSRRQHIVQVNATNAAANAAVARALD